MLFKFALGGLLLLAATVAEAGPFKQAAVEALDAATGQALPPAYYLVSQPKGPTIAAPSGDTAVVATAEPTPVVASDLCVRYRHIGRKVVDPCCKPYETRWVCVKHPCTCCDVLVPVCLPACIPDTPCVHCRGAILAQGVVSFDYGYGIKVNVRIQRDGDLVVTYYGA